MEKENLKPGDKVRVTATNEQLVSIGMDNAKINRNLRKYESTISEVLNKGGFPDPKIEGLIHRSIVLDSTFIIPACWLKIVTEDDEEIVVDKEDKKVEKEIKSQPKETIEVELEEEEQEDEDENQNSSSED